MEDEDMPTLHHLVRQGLYQEATKHLDENPQDVTRKDARGMTALHWLCDGSVDDNDADEVVALAEKMVNLCPEIAAERDNQNSTPLHASVEQRGETAPRVSDLALLLIRTHPEAVNVIREVSHYEHERMTPFHLACQANADIKVLQAMLEQNPSLASQPYTDTVVFNNALRLLWDANENTIDDSTVLILLTALKGRVVDPLPTNHLVHAVCNYPCTPEYIGGLFGAESQYFLPQLWNRDDRGNLPLHYAVNPTYVYGQCFEGTDSEFLVLAKDLLALLVDFVLKIYSDAASMTGAEGKLPLFMALSNTGVSWNRKVILRIAEAHPQALHRRDSDMKLFPVLLAATQANESNEHLSVTYELLLKTPELLLHALPS